MAGGQESEIGLGVSSMILSDVVLNPGAVDFGTVGRGRSAEQVLTIDRIGKPDWKITKMVSASKVLRASLQETRRGNGEVGYRLNVSLKPEITSGVVRDEIRLVTNDPETPAIPILVTAQVQGDLSASPSLLPLGERHLRLGGPGQVPGPGLQAVRHRPGRGARRRLRPQGRRRLEEAPPRPVPHLQSEPWGPAGATWSSRSGSSPTSPASRLWMSRPRCTSSLEDPGRDPHGLWPSPASVLQ